MGNCLIEPKLKKSDKLSIFKPMSQNEQDCGKRSATKDIRRLYNVKDYLLGSGAFGKVYLAESKTDKNVKYAVKVIPIRKLSNSLKKQMEYELEILYKIDHPYVI
jgi:serine/threonine protein kinase